MIFISATDTGVGKTFYSKKLLEYLLANSIYQASELAYYKPIQCGQDKDYKEINKDLPNVQTYCSYDLQFPASPNFAAKLENIQIDLNKIQKDFYSIKAKHKFIVVEGAGGLAVPLNDQDLVSDIAKVLSLSVLLIIRPNLGTINHSLLSIKHLRNRKIKLEGIIPSDLDHDCSKEQLESALQSIIKIGQTEIFSLDQYARKLSKNYQSI